MTVAGQPQVSYTYDNANRVTQIAQGSSSVGFSYDNANRRSSLALPNGVSVSYAFDNDSRITGITYQFGANTLGNLSYTYDQLGRRSQVGGSFARTGMPGAVTSATYDGANELTNWNGTAISYDANGNMLSDGSNVFTWNARNQVATLNSVSLQYDGAGRRIKNAAGTSFLYDGANATQELSGTTPTANIWTGGVDELFQRSDGSGTIIPIADALGNIIALTDLSGSIVTTYSYDPFGNTTTAGAVSANPSQYTGRENEGNGLYFYRARYYSPVLHRFVSEDPLRLSAGPNAYAYALDNPISFSDPSGLCSDPGGWGIRYCVQAFIPDTHVGLTGFQGDGRGPQSDGGTFRFGQDVYNQQSYVANIDSHAGISHFGPWGVEAHLGHCDGKPTFLPKLHGRKINLSCAGSDGWLFGLAPNAAYDLTITETASGTTVTGTATTYPSIEVWQYGNGDPKLVFYQDARPNWFTELPFPQQTVTPTFTPWR
jgi:RHS repeat-associated protein